MSSLPFKNKLLTLALKKYAITDIKVFRSCLTLLDFLIFLIYFAQIVVNVKKWKLQEINLQETANLFTFIKENRNGKLHSLCSPV